MRIAVLGAGSLGALIAAGLAAGGVDVVLVARGEAGRAMSERGIVVEGGLTAAGRPAVVADARELREVDVLLLAVKTYDTQAALAGVDAGQVGAAASVQNGVLKDELLRRQFGAGNVLGCATMLGADKIGPATIRCTLPGKTFFGELNGQMTERVAALARAFEAGGLPVHATQGIVSLEWTKQVLQAATAPLAAITRLPLHEMYLGPAARLYVRIVREAAAVAHALGTELDAEQSWGGPMQEILALGDDAAIEVVHGYARQFVERGASNIRISMQQDVLAGRRTEIDETAGYVVEEAERLGIPTPYLDFACQAVRSLVR